jgi:DNA modification methylase
VDWTDAYKLFPGVVAYVWHADRFTADIFANLSAAEFEIRSQIIWRKPSLVISRGHYHWQHEPCWYAARPKSGSSKWCGDRSQATIWDISNKVNSEGKNIHSTQKPIECMMRPIRNHGGAEDDVYDPFCGSGTTIIAAEKLSRRCIGIEIEPKYCDVIVARWEEFTGKKAKRE